MAEVDALDEDVEALVDADVVVDVDVVAPVDADVVPDPDVVLADPVPPMPEVLVFAAEELVGLVAAVLPEDNPDDVDAVDDVPFAPPVAPDPDVDPAAPVPLEGCLQSSMGASEIRRSAGSNAEFWFLVTSHSLAVTIRFGTRIASWSGRVQRSTRSRSRNPASVGSIVAYPTKRECAAGWPPSHIRLILLGCGCSGTCSWPPSTASRLPGCARSADGPALSYGRVLQRTRSHVRPSSRDT